MPTRPTPKKARARPSAQAKRRATLAKRKAAAQLARGKAAFLESLEATHLVTEAAKAARVHRSTVYEWRSTDEAFAAAWADSEERSTEVLEQIAVRRAAQGSDVLLIFMLKARRPDVYRDNQRVEHVGADGGPISAEIVHVDAQERSDAARQYLARIAGD